MESFFHSPSDPEHSELPPSQQLLSCAWELPGLALLGGSRWDALCEREGGQVLFQLMAASPCPRAAKRGCFPSPLRERCASGWFCSEPLGHNKGDYSAEFSCLAGAQLGAAWCCASGLGLPEAPRRSRTAPAPAAASPRPACCAPVARAAGQGARTGAGVERGGAGAGTDPLGPGAAGLAVGSACAGDRSWLGGTGSRGRCRDGREEEKSLSAPVAYRPWAEDWVWQHRPLRGTRSLPGRYPPERGLRRARSAGEDWSRVPAPAAGQSRQLALPLLGSSIWVLLYTTEGARDAQGVTACFKSLPSFSLCLAVGFFGSSSWSLVWTFASGAWRHLKAETVAAGSAAAWERLSPSPATPGSRSQGGGGCCCSSPGHPRPRLRARGADRGPVVLPCRDAPVCVAVACRRSRRQDGRPCWRWGQGLRRGLHCYF